MATTIFEITFYDGRSYRVLCMNKSQQNKMKIWYNTNKHKVKYFESTLSGIHTTSQFLTINN